MHSYVAEADARSGPRGLRCVSVVWLAAVLSVEYYVLYTIIYLQTERHSGENVCLLKATPASPYA